LQIFTFQERGAFVPCWFVLPPNYKLHVTDGQHRIEGLRGAMTEAEYGKFQGDAVAVSIVEESSIEKTHQDFYDAAQVKPLPPAMLVEYDQREPLNRLTRDLVREVPIFKDRTLRVGRSVGKKSPMMFTNNMVRRCVVMMVTGDDSKEALAATAIAPKQEMWRKRLGGLLKGFSHGVSANHLHGFERFQALGRMA
jgi:DNA sulfur modification protein DndB